MEQTLEKNNELITLLLGKVSMLDTQIADLKDLVKSKLSHTKKEYVDDDWLEEELGLTLATRHSLVNKGILKKYKFGKARGSKNFYKTSEIYDSLEKGLINPKSKITRPR